MKKVTIKKQVYIIKENGVLVPADLVKETGEKVTTPVNIANACQDISHESQEHCVVFTLNGSNSIINRYIVTKGLVNQSQVHPREIFRPAIKDNAVSIVMVHNHPSGILDVSNADRTTTTRIFEAGKLLGIGLLDHIIVSSRGHKSIRDESPQFFN